MSPAKIVIIGGGSFSWGPTFLRDLFITPELRGSTLVLEDINPENLALTYALGSKMIADFGLDFKLESSLSLEEALPGADFVILTITTGGLEAMRHDLEIPARYGIRHSVGDTVGPGGLARALRNIPVVAGIAHAVQRLAPGALFLNYTNPLSALTRTLCREADFKVVGLCHEWPGVRGRLAQLFGVPPEQITARVGGINHLPWVTELAVGGQALLAGGVGPAASAAGGLYSVAAQILAGEIEIEPDDPSPMADHGLAKAHLLQLYGALPGAGDRHIVEFFPFFLSKANGYGAAHRIGLTGIADRQAWRQEDRGWIEAALRGDMPLEPFMQHMSGEAAGPILAAVVGGGRYQGILNLPNQGQIENLPQAAIVETDGVIDALGPRPLHFGRLPAAVQAVVERHLRNQELTVEAGLTGDRRLALQALLNDPLAGSLSIEQTGQMLDELLAANQEFIPVEKANSAG